jgi:hypothetical protein
MGLKAINIYIYIALTCFAVASATATALAEFPPAGSGASTPSI